MIPPTFATPLLTSLNSVARSREKRNCRLTSTIVNRPRVVYRRKSLDREERTLELVALVPSIYLFWYATKPRPSLRMTAIPRLITSKNHLLILLLIGERSLHGFAAAADNEGRSEEEKKRREKRTRKRWQEGGEGRGGEEREQREETPA